MTIGQMEKLGAWTSADSPWQASQALFGPPMPALQNPQPLVRVSTCCQMLVLWAPLFSHGPPLTHARTGLKSYPQKLWIKLWFTLGITV